jgi:NAD(P)-dependent dehydrogenase (short-subunit alcohol dehydrogenase family)
MPDIALVTGTSSGMGLTAAVALAGKGLTVVATMRDTNRAGDLLEAAAAAGVDVDVRALDVTDEDGAAACVDGIVRDHGGVDVLVNNAGRCCVGTAEQLDLATVREQLEVNYLGAVTMTKLVLPGMRSAGRGRVVTVTSVGGAVGQPFADAYCGAKFAAEGFMQSLAVVAERFGVWVSVIEPAAVASDFVANVRRPSGADDPYSALLAAYVARTESTFANAQSPAEAGAAIAACATASGYRFRWQTSTGATAFVGMSLADLDGERVLGATRSWIA